METALTKPNTGLSLFDSGTFEQMGLIAAKLAQSSLIPQSLRAEKNGQNWRDLPIEQVAANCFRIVEQAQRWGMSPFAVVDCASVVHGKLMWEGKLIAAALETTMGIRLDYSYEGSGESRKVKVSGKYPDEENIRTIEGNVTDWKTDQWKGSAYDQRLAYRGAREWARRHAPGAILGVYTADEFDEEGGMRNITQQSRVIPDSEQPDPFKGTALENLSDEEAEKQVAAVKKEPAKKEKKPDETKETEPDADVIVQEGTFKGISEKTKAGEDGKADKTWFECQFLFKGKAITLYTWSKSLADALREQESGMRMKVSMKAGNREGTFTITDFSNLIVEGGLL